MSATKYVLTEEHQARLPEFAAYGISLALRTDPQTEADRERCRAGIRALYEAAGLTPPSRVVFVPSPLVGRFVAGFAAWIWHARDLKAEVATWDATEAATKAATGAATWAATMDATEAATWNATRDATKAATMDATEAATRDATRDAMREATRAATMDATEAATWNATMAATMAATTAATEAATRDATEAATMVATEAAMETATEAATRDATWAATWAATEAATWNATRDATRDATWDATEAATWDATEAATWDATEAATWNATRDAMRDATEAQYAFDDTRYPASTRDATWWGGLCDMRALAAALGVDVVGLQCAEKSWCMQQGGNMWAGYVSWLEFFRLVAELPIDWSCWKPWHDLAESGGYRWLHPEFAIICDFPREIHRDEQNRPHRTNGPFICWGDGTRLYSWHGIRVPEWVIEHPERISTETIAKEENAEVRRVQIEQYGWRRYLADVGAVPISEWTDEGGQPVRLYDVGGVRRLHVVNSTEDPGGTRREYLLRVPAPGHTEHAPWMNTAHGARNWTCGLPAEAVFEAVS